MGVSPDPKSPAARDDGVDDGSSVGGATETDGSLVSDSRLCLKLLVSQ